MEVIHNRQFAFLHIPKTGGCSITESLNNHCRCRHYHDSLPGRVRPTPHVRAVDMNKKYEWFANYFTCAFVRNPWDRMVSLYHYWCAQKLPKKRNGKFVMEKAPLAQQNARMREAANYAGFEDWAWATVTKVRSQLDYICDGDGQLLVTYVGRFERLASDYIQHIATRLGIPANLPKRNQSEGRRDYHTYYTAKLRDMVGEHFIRELEAFGYKY